MTKNSSNLLNDKVVLISGGSAGCGWGFTLACTRAGAQVVVADINPVSDDRLELASQYGKKPDYIKTDVSLPENILETVSKTIEKFSKIDGLVNNAGLTLTGSFLDFELEVVERLYHTNLRSVFVMSQAVGKQMVKQGFGSIVNISSVHAKASSAEYEMYAATKGGICSMSKAMSWSLGKHGVRVNTLCPGLIRTEPIHKMSIESPDLEKAFNAMHATNRFSTVEQLGQSGVYLLSDMSISLTGADIVADQGTLAGLVHSDVLT